MNKLKKTPDSKILAKWLNYRLWKHTIITKTQHNVSGKFTDKKIYKFKF